MAEKVCVFCGRRATSREHVWPKWLREHITADRKEVLFAAGGLSHRHGHRIDLYSWQDQDIELQVGGICRSPKGKSGGCNDGWMEELESATRPVLAPLVSGEKSDDSLSAAEQGLLARWAWKTALVFDLVMVRMKHEGESLPPIHPGNYSSFYENRPRLPGGIIIGMGAYNASGALRGWRAAYKLLFTKVETDGPPATGPIGTIYFVTLLQVGRVVFRIVGPIRGQLIPTPSAKDRHPFLVRIHPPEEEPAIWPRNAICLDYRGLELLAHSATF